MLDLDRGEDTFGAVTAIDLVSRRTTYLEVQPVTLNSVTVNDALDVALLDHGACRSRPSPATASSSTR